MYFFPGKWSQEPTTGEPAGPWTVAQLRARWQRDEINGLTPVWHVGLESWTPIAEMSELKETTRRRDASRITPRLRFASPFWHTQIALLNVARCSQLLIKSPCRWLQRDEKTNSPGKTAMAAHGVQRGSEGIIMRHHPTPERIGYAGQLSPAEATAAASAASASALQLHQMQAELDKTRRQLEEERQVSQKYRELLVSQRAAYTQEITSLQSNNDHLSHEMMELIQDLERTLSSALEGKTDGLATMKRVLSERCLEAATPVVGPVGLKSEKSERLIPSWNEMLRHAFRKDDDGSSIGSVVTRCASSLSSTTSQTSLSDA
eukprot:s64_g11.t1